MKKNKNAGIIYTVECNITGKFYVGATKDSIEQRKLDHLKRANRGDANKFQEAISTYGAEAFSWEQIDTASCIDELALKEKQYILVYNSKEEGYNADSGGGFKKTVYQYNQKDGSLIKSYDCLESAGNVINATKQQLSRACLSVNKSYGGFYWSYEYIEPFKPELDKRFRTVKQYEIDETWIKTFS